MRQIHKKARDTLVTWVVVYPLITALLFVFEPLMVEWPMPLKTLVLSGIMVPAMVLWAMPRARILFHDFLNPQGRK